MTGPSEEPPAERFRRRLTVAHVRHPPGVDHAEVMFYESARFYRLRHDDPSFAAHVERLEEAALSGEALTVVFASLESDVIEEILREAPGSDPE